MLLSQVDSMKLFHMAKSPKQAAVRKVLAQNLRYARVMLAISQEEMAERSQLHRTRIGAIERGSAGATIDTVEMLARAIGVEASVLLMPSAQAQPLILKVVGG